MSDLIIYEKTSPPEIPEEWDYDESVKKVKGQIYKIRFMTAETIGEIWLANQILDGRGGDRKSADWKSKVKNLTFDQYCQDIGIAKQTAYNWFESFQWKSPRRLVGKFTGDIENYTPEKVISSVKEVLGDIDLDPASNLIAQDIVKARKYYTEKEDGLNKVWYGRVFLNPPYKYPLIENFINKLIEEYQIKNVISAILLTNNNTDTNWFHKASYVSSAICFTKGRINFYKEDGTITQPTNGQTFFYFGRNREVFINVFSKQGMVVEIVD